MLTIKYVNMKSGQEIVKSAHTVLADRCDDGRRRVLVYQAEPGSKNSEQDMYIGEGPVTHTGKRHDRFTAQIYVMNDKGSTVAVYGFEESNVAEAA